MALMFSATRYTLNHVNDHIIKEIFQNKELANQTLPKIKKIIIKKKGIKTIL